MASISTHSYKILDSHKIVSGRTQSRCPSPITMPTGHALPLPAPILQKAQKAGRESPARPHAQVIPQGPRLPTLPLLPGHVVYSTGCCVSRILNSPVPLVSPDLSWGHTCQLLTFLDSQCLMQDGSFNPCLLPSTTCPCQRPAQIRHHTQSPDTVQFL